MAGLHQQTLTPIRKLKKRTAATRLQFCQLEHILGESDQWTLEPRVRKERWKAPRAMWHEKERLREGQRKEARQSEIKQYILLFPCQRHAGTKTKQKQGASLGLYPGRNCLLASTTWEPIAVVRAHWTCHLQLFPFSQDSRIKPAHAGSERQRQTADRHISKCWKDNISDQAHYWHTNLVCYNFSLFTSYKILRTSFQFFHLSVSSKPQLIALAYQNVIKPKDLRIFPLSPFI